MKTSKISVSFGLFAAWIVALSFITACTNPIDPTNGGTVRALTATEEKVAAANSNFGLRLFQEASRIEGTQNLFISPLSYMQALTMTANGAANATRDSMAKALQISGIPMQDVNNGTRTLTEYLLGLDPKVQFRIANGIWHNQRFTLEQSFLNTVRDAFGAEVRGMAFGMADVKGDINRWVESKTNNRIKDLIQSDFSSEDLMCLVNAVYFNADWKFRFDTTLTREEPFIREDGSRLMCKMMNLQQETTVRTANIGRARLVEIPYGSDKFSMTILLPNSDERLNSVIASLTPQIVDQGLQSLTTTNTLLVLPKFTMKTRYEERRPEPRELHAMGMGLAFSNSADFSAMYRPPVQAAISFVVHQTFLQVDERGTEAAAATAVGIRATSIQPQPPTIRFDRPFAFFIREKSTNMILFAGSLYEPKFQP